MKKQNTRKLKSTGFIAMIRALPVGASIITRKSQQQISGMIQKERRLGGFKLRQLHLFDMRTMKLSIVNEITRTSEAES